jgi:hypothetical protein
MTAPRIISRELTELSLWVTPETISVARDPATIDVFHAFRQPDYVQVFTMTAQGAFVLVRQYRPVVEQWTIEFPEVSAIPARNQKLRRRANSKRKPGTKCRRSFRS